MNFNTMCKRWIIGFAMYVLSALYCQPAVWAADQKQIEKGDILIIYSDGSDKNTGRMVSDMVEILTYQSFKVSYGTASECMDDLNKFSYVICYDITTYPSEFPEKLRLYEENHTGETKEASHIFFVGNEFLKAYLDQTGRDQSYEYIKSTTGKIRYNFDDLSQRTSMAKEPFFLFLKNLSYKNGGLTVSEKEGYVCAREGALTHLPITDFDDPLIKAVFIKEVAQWKWPFNGSPNIFPQYIVVNKVYPYEDPEKLMGVVKMLVKGKTPFVISVMPMYVNGDYPAMVRFCEILRYAQANGGAVIINTPINQMNPLDKNVVLDYLAQALSIYNKQGVYPLALQVPRNWMFHPDTIEIMRHFKTIVTSNEEDSYLDASEGNTNEVYKDGHQWIGSSVALDDLGTSYVSAYSTAVWISMEADPSEILLKINACRSSRIPLKSLWDMEHSYWMEKDLMTYGNQGLILNQKKQDLSFLPSTYVKNFDYHRNMLQRFSKDLTSQNRLLIFMVGITSLVFLLFILFARYNNRRNYFFGSGEKEKDQG